MKSSSSSPSSPSSSSRYFSPILSPCTEHNMFIGFRSEEDSIHLKSSFSAAASSSSLSSPSSSLTPSSSTTENTHGMFLSFREEETLMTSSSASYSSSRSSSANPSPGNNHDVFISFRGEDTRHGFVSHLHSALKRSNIRTYADWNDLQRGDEISSTLLRAIEQSKVSLIVFSENYASSRWTLDELVKIMECKRTRGIQVLPIFYRIKPSDVRNQRRAFASSSKKRQNEAMINAMAEAASLAGWEISKYRSEAELVDEIVTDVTKKLESMRQGSDGSIQIANDLQDVNLRSQSYSDEPDSSESPDLPAEDSFPNKCLSNRGSLLGHLIGKTREAFLRKENERLVLNGREVDEPQSSDGPDTYVYRNRYLPKQQQSWWAIR